MTAEETILRASRSFFRGRTLLVTGASSGIGYDIARVLAGLGAKTGLIARRQNLLDDLAARIRDEGGNAFAYAADVTIRSEVQSAIGKVLNEYGHLDILINSAGILERCEVETMDPESLRRMLEVNLFGTLHATQAVLPAMRRARAGNIVTIASLAGRRGIPRLGGYSASKFALVGLTEALRVELFGSGVRVSLVMPGVVDTPMTKSEQTAEGSRWIAEGMPGMPVRWVTWAVIAALRLGLAEVDVPPGAAVVEKLAALFPSFTDAALALSGRVFGWAANRRH
ncbi:MAG TPA: SDR family oxidoreductase [Candidatus Binataceae bacterium]|nr:SDR family oxidoreductase [Candidatus Binataceae bacterium]